MIRDRIDRLVVLVCNCRNVDALVGIGITKLGVIIIVIKVGGMLFNLLLNNCLVIPLLSAHISDAN